MVEVVFIVSKAFMVETEPISLSGPHVNNQEKTLNRGFATRSLLVWQTSNFTERDKKSFRGNIRFDHAEHVRWNFDSKSLVVHRALETRIEIYKLVRNQNGALKDLEKIVTFPEFQKDLIIISLAVAVSGKFVVTCDNKNKVTLWTLKGRVIETFDTKHGSTYCVIISPCGKFIATTGSTPEARVYEVNFSKTGSVEGVKRIFDLDGHSSGIYNCSICSDSTKMATVSEDGTWRLYHTLGVYDKGQDPTLASSGEYAQTEYPACIALSPDGRTIAVASGPNLMLFSGIIGEPLYSIENIYSDFIKEIIFDPSNKYLLTLGEKTVRVFYNVAGYHTSVQDFERSKSNSDSSALRDRMSGQIAETKAELKALLKKISSK